MHKRLFYLDNLKTFALLLGVLFHTSIIYAPDVGYAIKSYDLNYVFSILVLLIHVFRMPLFFFLSGFFSFMVLDKKGGKNFTLSRLERMFAPMLAGIFFFAPVQYYLVYNQNNEFIPFWRYYFKFFSYEEFDFSHIWFLVYLFTYSFFLITNYKLNIIDKLLSYSYFGFKQKLKKIVSHVEKKFSFYTVLFLKAIVVCFIAIVIANFCFNKNFSFFRIKPVSFLYYLSFFITGVIAYKKNYLQNFSIPLVKEKTKYEINNKNSFTSLKIKVFDFLRLRLDPKPIYIFIGILLLFATYLYLDKIDPYWMDFTYEYKKILLRIGHLLIDSILAWCFIFILLHFSKQHLDHFGPILDYLRNSGMSIYLIHHPISLVLGHLFIKIKIPLLLKFSLHTLLVYFLSFFFYHFIIKKSFILKRVFGTK